MPKKKHIRLPSTPKFAPEQHKTHRPVLYIPSAPLFFRATSTLPNLYKFFTQARIPPQPQRSQIWNAARFHLFLPFHPHSTEPIKSPHIQADFATPNLV
jgi:hypothetical protein